jgi:uncharacterized protein (TIGR03382 family)
MFDRHNSSGTRAGTIIGAIIGATASLVVLVVAALLLLRRRRKQSPDVSDDTLSRPMRNRADYVVQPFAEQAQSPLLEDPSWASSTGTGSSVAGSKTRMLRCLGHEDGDLITYSRCRLDEPRARYNFPGIDRVCDVATGPRNVDALPNRRIQHKPSGPHCDSRGTCEPALTAPV